MAQKIRLQATLHPQQARILDDPARFNVLACGRRWGKTTLGIVLAGEIAARGRPVGWFSPTYRMLSDAWREMVEVLQQITAAVNQTEHRLELINGGIVDMWSLDNPDTARGRRYARVIVDEAAQAQHLQPAWENVIRPTLSDFRGDAWFMSTPSGRNYFWQLWQQGQNETQEDWRSWQMPTSTNPFIHPDEIASAQRQLPEQVFAQEYLAQFIEDSGIVFRNVTAVATSRVQQFGEDGHDYSVGLDWGKLNDFTVISVVDVTDRRQVFLDRFNRIDYEFQLSRLLVALDRYPGAYVAAESNSVGEPLVERLRREGVQVHAVTMTTPSKTKLIEDLALAFERGELEILSDVVQMGELLAYAAERLPSGLVRYGAPAGMHDDTVMALALAWSAAAHMLPDAQLGVDRFAGLSQPGWVDVDLVPGPTGLRFRRVQRADRRADVLRFG